jgi:hypothetical protein
MKILLAIFIAFTLVLLGLALPFHVEAGNMFGTGDYFPFFIADVTEIRFPGGAR